MLNRTYSTNSCVHYLPG